MGGACTLAKVPPREGGAFSAYPSHSIFDLVHRWHDGFSSSHLMRRRLQYLADHNCRGRGSSALASEATILGLGTAYASTFVRSRRIARTFTSRSRRAVGHGNAWKAKPLWRTSLTPRTRCSLKACTAHLPVTPILSSVVVCHSPGSLATQMRNGCGSEISL